jgi:pimeloyl-ACP methyl ester carboxylesterase
VIDRRGYGRSLSADGEDFLRDAEDIADLMGAGAHLVGHSYGGLGVMFAAAYHPDATLSLTLLEPGTFTMGRHDPAGRAFVDTVRRVWQQDLPDEDWLVEFLKSVGSDGDALPPDVLAAALPLVSVVRRARPPFDADLPLAALASATFPKLVVSGGHSAGFDAVCDDLATRIGASRLTIAGSGHEVQFTGPPLNEAMRALWRRSGTPSSARAGH